MNSYKILIRPIDTEKTRFMAEQGQYTFQVARSANKIQVKRAVEDVFGVTVTSVNMINVPAKVGRRIGRRRVARSAPWKKAVVTLAEGKQIDVFEGA
ncbi:MAG: 50S ribosomal protein L23 [Chloroflexi bacterium]|nr:50S ribosomal protein L23 [Chloroflexota bacterium]